MRGITRFSLAALAFAALTLAAGGRAAAQAVDDTMADSAAATAAETAAPADRFIALDFGTRDTLEGFTANIGGGIVIFSGDVKFEAVNPDNHPDPLASDCAAASYLTIINLEKGAYRAAVIAQGAAVGMVPAKSFSVTANGMKVVDEEVGMRFFTANGEYYGIQFDDLPGTDWWGRYVQPVTPWQRFAVESDGSIRLTLDNCKLFALVLARAADVSDAQFAAYLDGVEAARRRWFVEKRFSLKTLALAGDSAALNGVGDRGYVVFSRCFGDDVHYNYVPSPAEAASSLAVSGAPGERVPLQLSVFARRDLASVAVTVSDFGTPDDAVLPASCVEVLAVRYKLRPAGRGEDRDAPAVPAYEILPAVIQRQESVTVPATTTKSWWLTASIPADAEPGTYAGTVTVKAEGVPSTEIPFTIEVYPFRLEPAACSIGLWYGEPAEQNYNTSLVGGLAGLWRAPYLQPYEETASGDLDKHVEAYRVAMIEADLKFLSERGFNGITPPLPRVTSVSADGAVTLDFALLDAYMPLLAKYDINTAFAGQSHLLGIGRQIIQVGVSGRKIPEYSDLHARAFKNAYAQMVDYYAKAGIKMLAYVVDEPRERNINPWNRNMEGTLYYLRLVNEVGGWPSTVTTMADENSGISHMPIMEEEDVVQPHPGTRDVLSVKYARESGKPLRYFNGSGFNRYAFGFYIWSQKPEGYWQWHYQAWSLAWNPFFENDGGHAVYPSPDGPVTTPKMERAAAGINDYRYALTLEKYIGLADASSRTAAFDAAREAKTLLAEIQSGSTPWVLDDRWQPLGVPDEKLAEWKSRIAKSIVKITDALE